MDGDWILPDVLAPGLSVVFCGSAAGRRSAELRAYYAGPGNRFWPLLHDLGLTPRRLRPEEFRAVLRYGIGLTDLSKGASGADADLPEGSDDPAGLAQRVLAAGPRILAFNGKRPAEVFLGRSASYGLQPEALGATAILVLPSTSRANAHFSVEPWRELRRLVERLGGVRPWA